MLGAEGGHRAHHPLLDLGAHRHLGGALALEQGAHVPLALVDVGQVGHRDRRDQGPAVQPLGGGQRPVDAQRAGDRGAVVHRQPGGLDVGGLGRPPRRQPAADPLQHRERLAEGVAAAPAALLQGGLRGGEGDDVAADVVHGAVQAEQHARRGDEQVPLAAELGDLPDGALPVQRPPAVVGRQLGEVAAAGDGAGPLGARTASRAAVSSASWGSRAFSAAVSARILPAASQPSTRCAGSRWGAGRPGVPAVRSLTWPARVTATGCGRTPRRRPPAGAGRGGQLALQPRGQRGGADLEDGASDCGAGMGRRWAARRGPAGRPAARPGPAPSTQAQTSA